MNNYNSNGKNNTKENKEKHKSMNKTTNMTPNAQEAIMNKKPKAQKNMGESASPTRLLQVRAFALIPYGDWLRQPSISFSLSPSRRLGGFIPLDPQKNPRYAQLAGFAYVFAENRFFVSTARYPPSSHMPNGEEYHGAPKVKGLSRHKRHLPKSHKPVIWAPSIYSTVPLTFGNPRRDKSPTGIRDEDG